MTTHERIMKCMLDMARRLSDIGEDEPIVVRAELVAQSRTLLVLKAAAKGKNGKLIATSTSHSPVASQNLSARPPFCEVTR